MPRKQTAGYIVIREGGDRPLDMYRCDEGDILWPCSKVGHLFATRRDAERAVNDTFYFHHENGIEWKKHTIIRLVQEPT